MEVSKDTFCVFCQKKFNKLYLFKPHTLSRCIQILKVRKERKFKFHDVFLPVAIDQYHGYHMKCYSNFIAVQAKYLPTRPDSRECSIDTSMKDPLAVDTEEDLTPQAEATYDDTQNLCILKRRKLNNSKCKDVTLSEPAVEFELQSVEDRESEIEVNEISPNKLMSMHSIICIYCGARNKKHKGKFQRLHTSDNKNIVDRIKSAATQLNDLQVLQRCEIFSPGGTKVIAYHHICGQRYKSIIKKIEEKKQTAWHVSRDYHKLAFDHVCTFITNHIIEENQMCYFSFLDFLYMNYLCEEYKIDSMDSSSNYFSTGHLLGKIINTFNNKIKIIHINKKKVVKANNDIVLQVSDLETLDKFDILNKAALILRQEIFKIEKRELSETHMLDNNLISGECEIPEILIDFYRLLLAGLNNTSYPQKLTTSFCNDIIFGVTNGNIKTSKHITLGMVLKKLTDSDKIINIVNNYGHCCSYSELEQFQIEDTVTSNDFQDNNDDCYNDVASETVNS